MLIKQMMSKISKDNKYYGLIKVMRVQILTLYVSHLQILSRNTV